MQVKITAESRKNLNKPYTNRWSTRYSIINHIIACQSVTYLIVMMSSISTTHNVPQPGSGVPTGEG